MPERFALILAGGRGERFWPWSRPGRPKQLLPLASGGRSLLRATLERLGPAVPSQRTLVLTSAHLVEAVRAECPAGVEVVGEPSGRNTAPAVGAAAVMFAARAPGASFAVLPADHLVEDVAAFRADLERAFVAAEREPVLVTLGIRPQRPETGFGYIRRGAPLGGHLYRTAGFHEKPDVEAARGYLAAGDFLWNSGIFVWRARAFLDALAVAQPDLSSALRGLDPHPGPGVAHVWAPVFAGLPSLSVDYAVLERAPNVIVIEASFDWDDLGSWQAWARRQPRDSRGNVVHGDALAVECDDCVVVGEGGTAAAFGLRRMVVVHVEGATLACPLDACEQLRRVSEALRLRGKG
jgi:mannose-1-phosphate guanylyltransferase